MHSLLLQSPKAKRTIVHIASLATEAAHVAPALPSSLPPPGCGYCNALALPHSWPSCYNTTQVSRAMGKLLRLGPSPNSFGDQIKHKTDISEKVANIGENLRCKSLHAPVKKG